MVLKRHLTPIGRRGSIHKFTGKGATEQTLPSQDALNTLTQGDPLQRTMQNYAKATPGPLGVAGGGPPSVNAAPSIAGPPGPPSAIPGDTGDGSTDGS